ncbi:hypothetical protein [Methanobrevibacter sp.]|uniref:hypothetical protein n=1 Tax=Methanobrevibacter sp. TaxID=66852 RepID=UPI00388EFA2D
MTKKILTLLIVLVAAISIASVCAADLTKEQDFNGLFKMKVDGSDNFTSIDVGNNFSSLLQSRIAYKNANETIFVFFYENDLNDAVMYASDGNITQFEALNGVGTFNFTDQMTQSLDGKASVGVAKMSDDQSKTVLLGGTNETLLKEYADTITF